MLDINSWKIFQSVEPEFVATVRLAMVVGLGEVGILVTTKEHAFSIGCGPLLGIKGITIASVPRKIFGLSGVKIRGIQSGLDFVFALTENGLLYTWGNNHLGQLGLGQGIPSVQVPTLLNFPNEEQVIQVACGKWHVVALTESGKVYSWGWTDYSRCYPPDSEEAWLPRDVLNEDGLGRGRVISIACGTWISAALRSNGQVWAWGHNHVKGLGYYILPTVIPLEVPVTKIVCGMDNALALDEDGALYFWGRVGHAKGDKPTQVNEHIGPVLDIGASWRSDLNVCRTESKVFLWGKCLEHVPKKFRQVNQDSIDMVFAKAEGVMCRPIGRPEEEEGRSVVQVVSELFGKEEGADICFVMEDGKSVYAHKDVLISRSVYFATMFNGAWKESILPAVTTIPLEDVNSKVFTDYLQYLYTDRIDYQLSLQRSRSALNLKKLLQLLVVADRFGQVDLLRDCETLLMTNLTVKNACEVFQVANKLNIKDLEKQTLEVMAPPNFGNLVQSDNAPGDVVKLIAKKLSEMGAFSYNSLPMHNCLLCSRKWKATAETTFSSAPKSARFPD